jgi:hypothetical protein
VIVYRATRTALVCTIAVVGASLAACGGGGSGDTAISGGPASGSAGATAAGGMFLAGLASDAAAASQPYEFVPDVGETGGVPVAFVVENKPAWATFDAGSGRLAGTPGGADVGSTQTIRITATVGSAKYTHELKLRVVAEASGIATVALEAPRTRTDGSQLANLAGYRIYYGKAGTRLDQFVDVKDARVTDARVSNLTPGTWYFSAVAYDAYGFESAATAVATKTIT